MIRCRRYQDVACALRSHTRRSVATKSSTSTNIKILFDVVSTEWTEMDDHGRRQRLPAGLRQLFADGGGGRTLATPLPPGGVVWPDPDCAQHQPTVRPAFWLTSEPVTGELWARLRAEHERSGLWPVLLDDSTQPWSA